MSAPTSQTFAVPAEQTGATLAAFVRAHLPDLSWSQVRRLIETRRVCVGGDLCLDPARRLREGSVVEVTSRPAPKPRQQESIKVYAMTVILREEKHALSLKRCSKQWHILIHTRGIFFAYFAVISDRRRVFHDI